jgi:pyruvate dehydrogenase E1 component beta subunit
LKNQTITYREALKIAIGEAMRNDERVFLMGEDVGNYGGCYAVSKGLSEEFGTDRVIDTPLSESGFVGAGIGAAIGGMRPIVEVMTVNFSLLALDQVVNNAATLRHMSGNQICVPLVIRMATGAGKQLAAQHSHSLENWYAHVPGIKVLAPATVADARYMLCMALKDPDPVILFEHVMLYNASDEIPMPEDCPDMHQACVRKSGIDISLITYGGSLSKTLQAASELEKQGVSAEVVDLRCLRPLDTQTLFKSVNKTHRVLVVDEGWRTGSLASEVCALVAEHCFWSLDAPPNRICSKEVPIPYPQHLERAATPQVAQVIEAALIMLNRDVT